MWIMVVASGFANSENSVAKTAIHKRKN